MAFFVTGIMSTLLIYGVLQARKLVSSAILVRDEDRPVLEEGEFYTHDLIGMTIILKESGEPVGTVVNIFNSGASDLLQVKLNSLRKIPGQIGIVRIVSLPLKAADDSIERWQSHIAN
ncbi:hypothetical protein ACS0TY_011544 [Phlomoides rotata]